MEEGPRAGNRVRVQPPKGNVHTGIPHPETLGSQGFGSSLAMGACRKLA